MTKHLNLEHGKDYFGLHNYLWHIPQIALLTISDIPEIEIDSKETYIRKHYIRIFKVIFLIQLKSRQ